MALLITAFLGGAALTPASASDSLDQSLYAWIRDRQDPKTGLVPSYSGDPALEGVAFTYDQALAVHVFCAFGDLDRAKRVIAFFERAERSENLYYTAYDSKTGSVWEYNVHTGPNAWIGMAALRVARLAKSRPTQALAAVLGDALARLQDAEGGLPGGPGITWYSTEHQLDAYAFFDALQAETGNPVYAKTRDAVLAWLRQNAFDPATSEVRRGKNDAVLACDTYSWSVAALGPSVLQKAGMDARAVMQRAEDLCRVTVTAGGKEISGFDFTDAAAIRRPAVVSTEWTAQAALSWRIAGDPDRASAYLDAIAPLVSGSALPYASAPSAETGHGWKTPAGEKTGSVAGTAYFLLARKGCNPFDPDARLPRAQNVGK